MDLLSKDQLAELVREHSSPCVSIYVATRRTQVVNQQDPIRFKNLLRAAEDQLLLRGLRTPAVQELLEPGYRLAKDDIFWQGVSGGIAAFISPGRFRIFNIPVPVDELVVVNDRPYLKPILQHLQHPGHFYVLALSQKNVRLFRGDRHTIEQVEVPGMPGEINEALQTDTPEQTFHRPRAPIQTGRGPQIFAGHGGSVDESKSEINRYFRQVNGALHDVLRDETAPLVLACVEFLAPIYRDANTYRYILENPIHGNPEGLSAEELHAKAWPVMAPILAQAEEAALQRFQELAGSNNGKASTDVREIVPAAHFGRVDALFVAIGDQEWGHFDRESGTVYLRPLPGPRDQDLLEFAAVETFLNGGRVFTVDRSKVPGPIAAVFRF